MADKWADREEGGQIGREDHLEKWASWAGEWMSHQDDFLHMAILRTRASGTSALKYNISRKITDCVCLNCHEMAEE